MPTGPFSLLLLLLGAAGRVGWGGKDWKEEKVLPCRRGPGHTQKKDVCVYIPVGGITREEDDQRLEEPSVRVCPSTQISSYKPTSNWAESESRALSLSLWYSSRLHKKTKKKKKNDFVAAQLWCCPQYPPYVCMFYIYIWNYGRLDRHDRAAPPIANQMVADTIGCAERVRSASNASLYAFVSSIASIPLPPTSRRPRQSQGVHPSRQMASGVSPSFRAAEKKKKKKKKKISSSSSEQHGRQCNFHFHSLFRWCENWMPFLTRNLSKNVSCLFFFYFSLSRLPGDPNSVGLTSDAVERLVDKDCARVFTNLLCITYCTIRKKWQVAHGEKGTPADGGWSQLIVGRKTAGFLLFAQGFNLYTKPRWNHRDWSYRICIATAQTHTTGHLIFVALTSYLFSRKKFWTELYSPALYR